MPILGIAGSIDGITPVYDPEARWTIYSISEIFTGTHGLNRFVPKVNDYVVNYDTNQWFKITLVDPDTLISTMIPITFGNSINNPILDPLLFIANNADNNTYKVYFDNSVTPHLLTVDQRAFIGGSMVHHAKIFKGVNTGPTGQVVAFMMDSSGTVLTDNIDLETIAINLVDNHHIKIAKQAYTSQTFQNGEYLTIVYYSDNGHVVEYRKLIVENTSIIRDINVSQRHITHISLESTFLSPVNNNLLEFPINVPITSLNMYGVVHYSDGQTTRMPVDNVKFRILGLERFVSTETGQRVKLKLSYALGPNEVCYNAVSSNGKNAVANYELVVTEMAGSYSVKLMPYPRWIDASIGYELSWFLVNLDRNIVFDVTSLVLPNLNSPIFNGKQYGTKQGLSVRINLRDVSVIFRNYIHVQNIDISLINPGTDRNQNWVIGFEPNQISPYGVGLYAKTQSVSANSTKIKLDSNLPSQSDWLQKVYFNTKPLMDNRREAVAPTPNYFDVNVGGDKYRFPISAWNKELTINKNIPIDSTVFIEFIKSFGGSDLKLGVSGLPVYEY